MIMAASNGNMLNSEVEEDTKRKIRGINDTFINDLNTGCLSWFLQQVKQRDDLALEIRQNYVNIYYRGGNALRIRQKKSGYSFEFDEKYCLDENYCPDVQMRTKIKAYNSLEDYRDNFCSLLKAMNRWFEKYPKSEREIQHNLIRVNTSNDFCILDIEYAGAYDSGERRFRFDMIAVSKGKLVIVEIKNGVSAMGGKSGIKPHYNDICTIIADRKAKKELVDSMKNISDNKNALGLLNLSSADIAGEEIEILFIIFNNNNRSKMFGNQIAEINKIHPAKIIEMNTPGKIEYDKAISLFS